MGNVRVLASNCTAWIKIGGLLVNLKGLSIAKLKSMQKELEEELEEQGFTSFVKEYGKEQLERERTELDTMALKEYEGKCSLPVIERPKSITEQLYGVHETLLGTLELADAISDKLKNGMCKENILDESIKNSRNGIVPCIDEIERILYYTNTVLSETLNKM